jgi:hypothetical protein
MAGTLRTITRMAKQLEVVGAALATLGKGDNVIYVGNASLIEKAIFVHSKKHGFDTTLSAAIAIPFPDNLTHPP